MGEASNQSCTTSMELLAEKQLLMTPPTHAHFRTVNTIKKLSPHHDGSTLYDSFELRAMTRQLNKAILCSNVSSPAYVLNLKSPFHRKQLDRIYRKGAKSPRRISCSQSSHAILDKKTSMRSTKVGTGGFVSRLWKKVKQGLLGNKQGKDG